MTGSAPEPHRGDLDDPFEIARLVRGFYGRVRDDDLLGPVFDDVAQVDWSEHLPKLTAFWSGILLGIPGFDGAPGRAHAMVHAQHPLRPEHFYRWVELFVDTIDQGWQGPRAEYAKEVAASVGRTHGRRLTGERLTFPGTTPGLQMPNARAQRELGQRASGARYSPDPIRRRAVNVPEQRMWFEDFEAGQVFESPPVTVTEEMILEFAGRYDPQPFHLDRAAAAESAFGELVGSGWHTAALTMRLFVDHGPQIEGGAVGLGGEELRWGPVRPDDQLHLRVEVVDKRISGSRPDRGLVRLRMRTLKQNGDEAQHFLVTCLVPARS